MSLDRCENCSRPGRGIYHVGDCPGVSATAVNRLISPFARTHGEERDRKLYEKSAPKNPNAREQNPGAYAHRPKPLRVRRRGGVTVGVSGWIPTKR